MRNNMSEQEIEALLLELQYQNLEDGEPVFPGLASAASFEEGGVMTLNRGVTLRMQDGSEFQITIVKSR